MSSKLVSAVVPTFNRADVVCRAVDSVLNQTWEQTEVVLVDDGSTDDTPRVVRDRYAGNPRVRYVRVDNGGVSRARNIGIAASEGAYVAFLDSDDYWHPWKVELQVKCLDLVPEAGMIWTNMAAVSEDGLVLHHDYIHQFYSGYKRLQREGVALFGAPRRVAAGELNIPAWKDDVDLYCGNIFSQLILGNLVHTSTAMLRRRRLQKVRGFREDLKQTGEDFDFHLRTCREGPVAYVEVESIGYTVGRNDQLTARRPELAAKMAHNALLTIESALADGAHLVKLPSGAVDRMLADTRMWATESFMEAGQNREARRHAWKGMRRNPRRLRACLFLLLSLLPAGSLSRLRWLYSMVRRQSLT